MAPESFWKTVFATPSTARAATIVMLLTWMAAAMWGWFFVEPTVLRDSQAARDYVAFASKIFPWLDNIRRLVPEAEKGLYLHSVYTVALAPVSIVWTFLLFGFQLRRAHNGKLTLRESLVGFCFCIALSVFYIFVLYNSILHPSFGKLHRTGYSFVMSPFMVPVIAPFFIMGFWQIFTGGTYSAFLSVRKLISKESRNG